MEVISTEEFVKRQAGGRVYICRSCFDNKKLIVMLKYEPGEKSETLAGTCPDCVKALSNCIPCKNRPPPNPRKP